MRRIVAPQFPALTHGGVKRGRNLGKFRLIGSGLKIRLRCSRNRDGPAHCFSLNWRRELRLEKEKIVERSQRNAGATKKRRKSARRLTVWESRRRSVFLSRIRGQRSVLSRSAFDFYRHVNQQRALRAVCAPDSAGNQNARQAAMFFRPEFFGE